MYSFEQTSVIPNLLACILNQKCLWMLCHTSLSNAYLKAKVLLNSIVWLTQHCVTDTGSLAKQFFFPDRPTHFNEREGDGKQNILWEWPYRKKELLKLHTCLIYRPRRLSASELACIIKQGFVQNVLLVFFYGSQVWPHTETTLLMLTIQPFFWGFLF